MSISKALRFEVLRRDGFACTYCGRKPPDVELHIDHVLAAALGGQDVPENLCTSCVDCNSGKGSTPPDAEMVAQVSDDARRWADAIAQAGAEMVAQNDADQWFVDLWTQCGLPVEHLPLDAKQRIARLRNLGLPREVIEEMFWVALGAQHVPLRSRYAYFNGCCNRRLDDLHRRAAELVDADGEG